MSLEHHLHIGSPLIWVTTDEPVRAIDIVCTSSDRAVYRMDVFDKFVRWEPTQKTWKKVVHNNAEGDLAIIESFEEAVGFVIADGGVLIVEHAHLTAEALTTLYSAISHRYLQAVRDDDGDAVPPTFVLLSYSDKVPPEFIRETVQITFELPDVEALTAIATHVAGNTMDAEFVREVAEAGRGLTEFEFTTACLNSLVVHSRLDPAAISKTKVEVLSKSTVLEISQPTLTLDDIGGLDQAKDLFAKVAWVWHNQAAAKELGIKPVRRILLVGVPGGGKSAMCEAISNSLGLELAKAGVSQAMSKWVGESEQNMRRTFRAVKVLAPIVLWVDEFGRDMSGSGSSNQTDGGTTDRVHGEFLTGLQELPDNVILVCAANRIDDLPPEMLRADRFDLIMFVGFPTLAEREEIFRIHLGKRAIRHNVKDLAKATPFFTGAEIKALIEKITFDVGAGEEHRTISDADLIAAAPKRKGRVWVNHKEAIVEMYKRAKIEWDWASSAQHAESDNIIGARAAAHIVSKPDSDFGVFREN